MSELQKLIVSEFLLQEREKLKAVEEEIRVQPLTYDDKINTLESILKKGITFGIQKGIFLEQERLNKIKTLKEKNRNKFVEELVFSLNHRIAVFRNQPRIKYAKSKYRKRKKHGATQLNIAFESYE